MRVRTACACARARARARVRVCARARARVCVCVCVCVCMCVLAHSSIGGYVTTITVPTCILRGVYESWKCNGSHIKQILHSSVPMDLLP